MSLRLLSRFISLAFLFLNVGSLLKVLSMLRFKSTTFLKVITPIFVEFHGFHFPNSDVSQKKYPKDKILAIHCWMD
jgi:hypothetical protein